MRRKSVTVCDVPRLGMAIVLLDELELPEVPFKLSSMSDAWKPDGTVFQGEELMRVGAFLRARGITNS